MPPATHKDSFSPEYRSWKTMRSRCRNPNDPAYPNYGARGITFCAAWNSYEQFLSDMGRRPTVKHTLERIDNERGYEPANCRWATRAEQLRNRRNNVWVDVGGQRMCLADAAKHLGVNDRTARSRRARGIPLMGREPKNGL